VALNGTTLKVVGSWQIPHNSPADSDFGASPTLFTAVLPGSSKPVAMVGACNKNGTYYALKANDLAAGPVWSEVIYPGLDECISAAAWNGHDLFFGSPTTIIAGTKYVGSVRKIDPATGAVIWSTALPGQVFGSPTLDGKSVLAAAIWGFTGSKRGVYLVNANTGKVLKVLIGTTTGCCGEFAQPVFADNYVFAATLASGLTAYTPSAG
jgi:outer membrane protein assembly factor BamB